MKQLVQNLKSGEMKLLEVPVPAVKPGNILVRVHYSLISAGTEAMKVTTARKGYIGKAKEKPEQVKQVLDTLKKEGVINTYRKVMNKLDSWSALGYSACGEVIEVGSEVKNFRVGDRVACAGQDIANHAEVISVPINLAAPIPPNVDYSHAAYTTLGAIAMQGVRQADLRIGESCAVIGLGLLGQITVQILNAGGIRVFGIDVNPAMVEKALQSGAEAAYVRSDEKLESTIIDDTDLQGVDAVIITAGTSSLDPVELSGRLARKKGRVIVVGAVPTGFSRDNYYKKELELRMSTSYGPGRYDPLYEEKGIDYPYGYVRWTENRNMRSFLQLIADNRIKPDILTSHIFKLEEALTAYDLILKKSEPFLGVLLKYHPETPVKKTVYVKPKKTDGEVRVGFVGAGSFAQTYLLPTLKKLNDVDLVGVATTSGNTARSVADRFGFQFATTEADEIFSDESINTVFIATRHDSHARLVRQALENGKHVFVEKPLAIKENELEDIRRFYEENPDRSKPMLMVGFNRRFAPLIRELKKLFHQPPVALQYRINAGFIPPDHWTQDPETGGGRILGEVCHFVDLAMFLSMGTPVKINALAMKDPGGLNDTLTVQLLFDNGSVANISYYSNGSKNLEKEYLEIFAHGMTGILNDFKELTVYGKKKKKIKSLMQDKGHKSEIEIFIKSIRENQVHTIPVNELFISSYIPFRILDGIKETQKNIK